VAADVARGGEDLRVGTGLQLGPTAGSAVRSGLVPGVFRRPGDLVQMRGWPAMDRLLTEGVTGRRRFLDRLVLGFDANHARVSTRYETAT
jgi:DNA replication and repair protein RecF